jgi:hypothetical protein
MEYQWTTSSSMIELHRVPGNPTSEPQHIWQASTPDVDSVRINHDGSLLEDDLPGEFRTS